jgi:nucleotide-binding universal stress UspA family protein
MTHRIVLGFDGSDGARAALDAAIGVARQHGSLVDVVHVVHMPPLIEDSVREQVRLLDEAEVSGNAFLLQAVTLLRAAGVEARARLANGLAWDQILRVAEEVQADLIVVGVRHHNALRLKLVRCTACHVVERARCAVLVARPTGWQDAHTDAPG